MEDATLIGSALGGTTYVDGCISEKVTMLKRIGERIVYLCSHNALTLLCHSLAIPKLLLIL